MSPLSRHVSRYVEFFTIRLFICVLVRTSRYVSRYVCLVSPDLDGYRAPKNGSLALRDPENCKVPKPKYEATALHEHLSIGCPNSSTTLTGKALKPSHG